MTDKIIQEELEKERKIKELNSVLVDEFDKAIKTGNVTKIGQDVVINFSLDCIPESLRNLFKERINIFWGEISNNDPIEKKKNKFLEKAISKGCFLL